MTPKEKAKELLDEMSSQTYSYQPYAGAHYVIEEIGWEAGKNCALIAVNEIINANPHSNPLNTDVYSTMGWWQEVKQEIEKL
jgi:hypothetical protein